MACLSCLSFDKLLHDTFITFSVVFHFPENYDSLDYFVNLAPHDPKFIQTYVTFQSIVLFHLKIVLWCEGKKCLTALQ